jgi:hypothetical protein
MFGGGDDDDDFTIAGESEEQRRSASGVQKGRIRPQVACPIGREVNSMIRGTMLEK